MLQYQWFNHNAQACIVVLSWMCSKDWHVASLHWGWTTDVTWTILTMSLLPFWALNVSVALLSMQGQKALEFHQKYLNLCSKDEQRSYGFGTTWGWVINDRIFIFGWTIPLRYLIETWYQTPLMTDFISIYIFRFYVLFKILICFKERKYLTVHVNRLFSLRAVGVCQFTALLVLIEGIVRGRSWWSARPPSITRSLTAVIHLYWTRNACGRQRLSSISLKTGKFSTNFNSDTVCTWNKVITDNLCEFWSCEVATQRRVRVTDVSKMRVSDVTSCVIYFTVDL